MRETETEEEWRKIRRKKADMGAGSLFLSNLGQGS